MIKQGFTTFIGTPGFPRENKPQPVLRWNGGRKPIARPGKPPVLTGPVKPGPLEPGPVKPGNPTKPGGIPTGPIVPESQGEANVVTRTFEDANIPSPKAPIVGQDRGFGIDYNHDHKFDPKQDGYLTFDMDGDGKYTRSDIEGSRNLLKSYSGDFDLNGDGRVSMKEKLFGTQLQARVKAMDKDGNGQLSNAELRAAGARFARYEENNEIKTYSVNLLPGSHKLGAKSWIENIDLTNGTSQIGYDPEHPQYPF